MSVSSIQKDQAVVEDLHTISSKEEQKKVSYLEESQLRKYDKSVKFLAEFEGEDMEPLTQEQEKKLVRKIDNYILFAGLISCTLPAMDKLCLSFANIYGLAEDTNLVGQQYSWLGSILFIGAIVGMYPNMILVQKFHTGKVYAILSMTWSVLTLMLCACHNFAGLALVRFLMGWFESVITPIAVSFIQSFYIKKEQPLRMTVIFAAITSTITGFFGWVVGHIDNQSLPIWKYLFLILGSISFSWGVFLWFFMPESPIDAKFLTRHEKYYAVKRVLDNQTGIVGHEWKWYQAVEVLKDPKNYCIFLFNICTNIPNGGINTFSGILFKNLGYSNLVSSLLSMPTGIFATIFALIGSYFAGKTVNYRCFVIVACLILPLIGTGLMYGLPYDNLAGQMVGLYMLNGYYGPYLIGVSLNQANVGGYTKKNVYFLACYLFYAAGNLIGPQTFKESQAPQYTGGTIAMLVGYICAMVLVVYYWLIATYQNKSRTDGKPEIQEGEVDDAMADLTDFEVTTFKYIK